MDIVKDIIGADMALAHDIITRARSTEPALFEAAPSKMVESAFAHGCVDIVWRARRQYLSSSLPVSQMRANLRRVLMAIAAAKATQEDELTHARWGRTVLLASFDVMWERGLLEA